jgi:hypothetical protein
MFLAAAKQFDPWMLDWGLVHFSGCDIDQTCVRMCQVNMMIYGLNGYSIKCALALSGQELQAVPEPWQSKYAEAIAEPDLVPTISAEVRSWKQQALF